MIPTCGANAQHAEDHDESPGLPPEDIKNIQLVVGLTLNYYFALDITNIVSLSDIATEKSKGTTHAMSKLINYSTTYALTPMKDSDATPAK